MPTPKKPRPKTSRAKAAGPKRPKPTLKAAREEKPRAKVEDAVRALIERTLDAPMTPHTLRLVERMAISGGELLVLERAQRSRNPGRDLGMHALKDDDEPDPDAGDAQNPPPSNAAETFMTNIVREGISAFTALQNPPPRPPSVNDQLHSIATARQHGMNDLADRMELEMLAQFSAHRGLPLPPMPPVPSPEAAPTSPPTVQFVAGPAGAPNDARRPPRLHPGYVPVSAFKRLPVPHAFRLPPRATFTQEGPLYPPHTEVEVLAMMTGEGSTSESAGQLFHVRVCRDGSKGYLALEHQFTKMLPSLDGYGDLPKLPVPAPADEPS